METDRIVVLVVFPGFGFLGVSPWLVDEAIGLAHHV